MLTAFFLLELVRIKHKHAHPLLTTLGNVFEIFRDEKDSDGLIASHIYLLIGCLWPIVENYSHYPVVGMRPYDKKYFRNLIGLIFIGVSDSMAAIIGKRFGRIRLVSKKSLEGSIAYLVSGLIAFSVLRGEIFTFEQFFMCLLSAVLELCTQQNDNLIIPVLCLQIFK